MVIGIWKDIFIKCICLRQTLDKAGIDIIEGGIFYLRRQQQFQHFDASRRNTQVIPGGTLGSFSDRIDRSDVPVNHTAVKTVLDEGRCIGKPPQTLAAALVFDKQEFGGFFAIQPVFSERGM